MLDTVQGKDGPLVKGTAVAISNIRKGTSDNREEEATSIMWTFWGKLAENAAEYLGKGSHVNIVGCLRNNNYRDSEGNDVYALAFTCEEIDYLESRSQAEARESRRAEQGQQRPAEPVKAGEAPKGNGRRKPAAESSEA